MRPGIHVTLEVITYRLALLRYLKSVVQLDYIRVCITVTPLVTHQIHCPFQPKQSPS